MLLFCSTMHFASGRVRRKTSQFVAGERCFLRKFSSNRTGRSQNCISPADFEKTHFFQHKVTVLPYLYALYSERALRKGCSIAREK